MFRRTDEIKTASMLSSQPHDDGSSIGQGDLRGHLGPATQRWTLQVKEEKNAAKEAFDGTTLAQFLFCPGWRQVRVKCSQAPRRISLRSTLARVLDIPV
jgi:hypothetical protein